MGMLAGRGTLATVFAPRPSTGVAWLKKRFRRRSMAEPTRCQRAAHPRARLTLSRVVVKS
jgi:hypothetical protein